MTDTVIYPTADEMQAVEQVFMLDANELALPGNERARWFRTLIEADLMLGRFGVDEERRDAFIELGRQLADPETGS
jgi:hypothetical protein